MLPVRVRWVPTQAEAPSLKSGASLGGMTEPAATADLERAVRAALRRRLQLTRTEGHAEWDEECVAAILAAAGTEDRVGMPHECDEYCRCDEHRTPLAWIREHACADPECEFGQGVGRGAAAREHRRAERVVKGYRALEAQVVAGLSTEAHHKVMAGGLPFCSCQSPLTAAHLGESADEPHHGDATGAFIAHALEVLAAERAAAGTAPASDADVACTGDVGSAAPVSPEPGQRPGRQQPRRTTKASRAATG